jgi:hypothetical protein
MRQRCIRVSRRIRAGAKYSAHTSLVRASGGPSSSVVDRVGETVMVERPRVDWAVKMEWSIIILAR